MLSADEVEAMIRSCEHLRAVWLHYQVLFEESELRRSLLHRIAPIFFDDLSQVFIEHLVLQVCRITDPALAKRGRVNLTLDYVLREGNFAAAPGDLVRLTELHGSIAGFRSKIVPARNRLVSHLDREAVMGGRPLGGASKAEWDAFWTDLEAFLHIVYTRYVDPSGTFYLNRIRMLTDADSVVKALKECTFFRAALDHNALTDTVADLAAASEFFDA